MTQFNPLVIENKGFPATRADINLALQAVGSNNSFPTAPATTYANMFWYDETAHILKMRSELNDVWISVGYLDQDTDTFKILDDTVVTTAAGVDTNGIIGDQTTATWQAGTGTTESLVSPAKVKASVIANAPSPSLNLGTFQPTAGLSFVDISVPSTATEININFYDLKMNDSLIFQLLGSGGSPITSGYYSSSGTSGAESGTTTGFYIYTLVGRIYNGVMSLTRASSSVWMETHATTINTADANGAGRLLSSETMTGIRMTQTNGAATFVQGQVSVSYR